jgi:hypothetical protein
MRGILTIALLAGALATPSWAASAVDPMVAFVKSCQTQMYLSAAACSCLVGKAKSELDAKEIAYLTIPGSDGPAAAAAAKALSGAEVGKVDKFMRTATNECQSQ